MLVTFMTLCLSRVEPDAANYQGLLKDMIAEGRKWAIPASGLPIDIVIEPNGSISSKTTYDVQPSAWQAKSQLGFNQLKFEAGRLSGQVGFVNGSKRSLWGVRFDLVGATESYKAKDSKGQEVILDRDQAVSEDSPVLFGDLQNGSSSGMYPIAASGIAFKPDTTQVVVHARLSGLTYMGGFGGSDQVQARLAAGPNGKLYIGSWQTQAAYVYSPSTGRIDPFATLDGTVSTIACNPVNGDVYLRVWSSHEVKGFTSTGQLKETIKESDDSGAAGLYGWPNAVSFSANGSLWVNFGSTYSKFVAGMPVLVVSKAGSVDLHDGEPMEASDDFVYVGTNDSVFRFDTAGKSGGKLIPGSETKLGMVHGAYALSLDRSGNVWVVEKSDENFLNRVSVFDRDGKFLRSFAHGAEQIDESSAARGYLRQGIGDVAVGSDGTVYLSNADERQAIQRYVPF